ncbi:hypothetical protein C8A03DRAFT_30733 [Achaetomium macrosporum]|uniref:Uncharacterized protein n=1 Tax=Achaetomium macrosporum TaxID=79813 RepID=A0AAN7HEY0_9PEZI|nr:hypothetical protein C8A03DRAFT_30733 [Achaetomium macrosporum]
MASATIPDPPTSRSPSARENGSDHGHPATLSPTRQIVLNRDAGQTSSWPVEVRQFCEADELPVDRLYSRKDTKGGSIALSKEPSVPWSGEGSDTSSGDEYYSPPVADVRRFPPVPPPQPPFPRGTPGFRPSPPPWHLPVGHAGGPPPVYHARNAHSASLESVSEDSDAASRSISGDGGPRHELQKMLERKQRRLWHLRRRMAIKRKQLQELRHRMGDMDNAFMQIFRPYLTHKSPVVAISAEILEDRLRELQSIREEYYTAESAYEAMESELDNEEFELQMLEVDLSRMSRSWVNTGRQGPFPPPPPPPATKVPGRFAEKPKDETDDRGGSAPPTPVSLLGISGDRHEDIHPLYQELLEAAGERQLAEEYVEDLEMRRGQILYDLELDLHRKRVRDDRGNQISEEELHALRSALANVPTDADEFEARFGITISDDELDFLRNYEVASNRARKELDSATDTLSHLRTLCLKKGVMRKHASYHEELAIYSGSPDWSPPPLDGNMAIDPPAKPSHASSGVPSLAHPRFPILLSNPAHVLGLLTPREALERALKLPKDDPTSALRRAECMKELGISMLMTKAENTLDYINQWLIHRLRTSPVEAELMLAVCEGEFKVVNLRRWQEEVLYWWRLDDAATMELDWFEGLRTPRDDYGEVLMQMPPTLGGQAGRDGRSMTGSRENSVIEGEKRARSEQGEHYPGAIQGPVKEGSARSVRSLG